jgi:hypothetical protein
LESSKECVKTHRSNLVAPKMDDVEIFYRYATGEGGLSSPPLVGVRGGFDLKVLNVNLT